MCSIIKYQRCGGSTWCTIPIRIWASPLRFVFTLVNWVSSVFYRGAFVFLSGATALQVLLYEVLFEGATPFHHSNVRLPLQLEKTLNKVIVTPRMHGIHHSMIRQDTDSNYSVIFSFWDRLQQTIRVNVAQDLITTGVPSYSDPDELTIGYLLKLPFTKIRTWQAATDAGDVRQSIPGKSNMAF